MATLLWKLYHGWYRRNQARAPPGGRRNGNIWKYSTTNFCTRACERQHWNINQATNKRVITWSEPCYHNLNPCPQQQGNWFAKQGLVLTKQTGQNCPTILSVSRGSMPESNCKPTYPALLTKATRERLHGSAKTWGNRLEILRSVLKQAENIYIYRGLFRGKSNTRLLLKS